MTRDIKFRGKRLDNGEWVYGDLLQFNGAKGDCDIFKAFIVDGCETVCMDDENTDLYATEWYKVDPKTVGEYTGLRDKNGAESYEGDIVKCTELRGDKIIEFVSEVFEDECCYFLHESKTCDVMLGVYNNSPTKRPLTEIEVVGNVYDNPDLLGKGDE